MQGVVAVNVIVDIEQGTAADAAVGTVQDTAVLAGIVAVNTVDDIEQGTVVAVPADMVEGAA